MKRQLSTWLPALCGLAAAPALAQIRPMGVPAQPSSANQQRTSAPVQRAPATAKTGTPARTGPDALAPANPDFKADQPAGAQAAPAPVPLPPAVWDVVNAADLLRSIVEIGKEGLN